MSKTLYISDLDGTLLDRHGALSDYTAKTIQRFISEGGLFTVATGRTLQSCNDLIWLLGLQIPAILTNGALIYDSVHARYLQINAMPLDSIPRLCEIMDSNGVCPFLYTMQGDLVSVFYREFFRDWDKVYLDQRIERFQGRFYRCDSLHRVAQDSVPIYMVANAPSDVLFHLQDEFTHVQGITSELYYNVYDNNYFIDIFPATASKAKGLFTLSQILGADEVVAFGDNYNDLSMLLAADRAYVPRNGVDAAKNVATDVLDYSYNDCVARFLATEAGWE